MPFIKRRQGSRRRAATSPARLRSQAGRAMAGTSHSRRLSDGIDRALLTDPQTSGRPARLLLTRRSPSDVIALFSREGFEVRRWWGGWRRGGAVGVEC